MVEYIYWSIGRLFYGVFKGIKLGKRSRLVLGGSVKGGRYIEIGDDFFIGKNFLLATYKEGDSEPKLMIGNNVCAQQNVRISCMNSVIIEDDVLMASTILITDNNHGINPSLDISYKEQKNTTEPVRIGKGTWIGEQSIVLSGSNIGEKCVIGANSVVTGQIDDYSMAVGNPARVIKKWNFLTNEWEKI